MDFLAISYCNCDDGGGDDDASLDLAVDQDDYELNAAYTRALITIIHSKTFLLRKSLHHSFGGE